MARKVKSTTVVENPAYKKGDERKIYKGTWLMKGTHFRVQPGLTQRRSDAITIEVGETDLNSWRKILTCFTFSAKKTI